MNHNLQPRVKPVAFGFLALMMIAGGVVGMQPALPQAGQQAGPRAGPEGRQAEKPQTRDGAERPRPLLRAMIERRTPEELKRLLESKAAALRDQLAAVEEASAMIAQGKTVEDVADRLSRTEQPLVLELAGGAQGGVRERLGERLGERGGERGGEQRGPGRGGRPPGGPMGEDIGREPGPAEGGEPDGRERGPRSGQRELMEAVRTELPAVFEKLEGQRGADPAIAERVAERLMPRVREAVAARESGDEPLFKLRMREVGSSFEALASLRLYREASRAARKDEAATATARATLREALATNFDDKLALGKAEVERFDARKAQVQQRIDHAASNRESLIDSAMADIEAGRMPKAMLEGPPRGAGDNGGKR